MSIHGNQQILPLFITRQNLPPIKEYDELTLAFYLLTKNLKRNEKVISFSRLLWPFLCIQGAIGTHIVLDGLEVFSKKGKLSNPPRQPVIGHLLRNVESLSKFEQLNKIIDVLSYIDKKQKKLAKEKILNFRS